MDSDLLKYQSLVEATYQYYKLPIPAKKAIAIHQATFDEANKTFSYECVNAESLFLSMFNLESTPFEKINYNEIFPQNKENKFDWSAMIGHVAVFQSTTKFYCFSELTLKWYKFVAFSPEKGVAVLIAEEITSEKEAEIAANIARFSSTEREN